MLSFKQFLQEELNTRQKLVVNSWIPDNKTGKLFSPKAVEISKHIIPEDEHTITIPAVAHIKNDVENHLNKHGYQLHSYKNGTAKDKYGRINSIGKILQKTKANEDLIDDYANDDKDSAENLEKHDIIISRHPYHVAEASTGKSWSSCAKMTPNGKKLIDAAAHLPNEIQEGTHVAYLVKKGPESEQEKINKAKARVFLKPYNSSDKNSHTILIPENSVYQKSNNKNLGFLHTLNDFTNKHFPMKNGKLYYKNKKVYDDAGNSLIPIFNNSKDNVDMVDKVNPIYELPFNNHISYDMLHHIIDKKHDPQILSSIAKNKNIKQSHIKKLLKHNNEDIDSSIIVHHGNKLTKKQIDDLYNKNNDRLNNHLLDKKSILQSHHIDNLLDKHLNDEQELFNGMNNNIDHNLQYSILYHTPEHENLRKIIQQKNLNSNHIDKIIDHSNNPIIHSRLIDSDNKNLTKEHVQKIYNKWKNKDLDLSSFNHPYNVAKNRLKQYKD